MNKIEVEKLNAENSSCNSCNSYENLKKISFINYDSRGNSSAIVIKLCTKCINILKDKL